MSGRLILVRHGQSYANVENRLDTRPPGAELTPLGRDQARSYADRRPELPGLLAHSTAIRARQTAAVIGGRLGVLPREFDGLHEVQVGELENRTDEVAVQTFDEIYRRWHHGDHSAAFPGGESGAAVLDRFVAVLTDLRGNFLDHDDPTADVVVVSHGAAIRFVAATLTGVDGEFALANKLANTDAVVLGAESGGRWSCLSWATHPGPVVRGGQDARTELMG